MVRPKASQEKLKVALVFADSVTRERCSNDDCSLLIDRTGDASIFALISKSLPNLVDREERDAVSQVQLNKYLVNCGYIPFRYRNRIRGTRDQWERGLPRWKNRRWANPFCKRDVSHVQSRLNELRDLRSTPVNTDIVLNNLKELFFKFILKSQLPNHSDPIRSQHHLLLGEVEMKPCPALRFIRSEFAFLAISFYQASRVTSQLLQICCYP